MAKTDAVCGALAARGIGFSLKFVCVVILGEARQDCFSRHNAGGDAVGLQVAPPYYWGMQLK